MRNLPHQKFYQLKQHRFVLICLILCLTYISCQQTPQPQINLQKEFYLITPQLPEQYNIVKSQKIGSRQQFDPRQSQALLNKKFQVSKGADYYVQKTKDSVYQKQRLNYLKGIADFDASYVASNLPQSKQPMLYKLNQDSKSKSQIYILDSSKTVPKSPQTIQKPSKSSSQTSQKEEQQISQQSVSLYNQFKNLQILKQKNLKQIIDGLTGDNQQQRQKYQNVLKLISYIVIGMILSYVVIKRATKQNPKLPKINQERKQLRLRDTMDEQDDDVSSSDSD